MKYINIIILFLLFLNFQLHAQETEKNNKIYNPLADASSELTQALLNAQEQNKHVMAQIGGNWCPWCLKVHKYLAENMILDSIIKADYVFLLINYSKENRNLDILKKLEYPQRFGFPVFVILDENGKRLHTQDSGFLEKENSYDEKKFKTFLLSWNKNALKDEKYLQNEK